MKAAGAAGWFRSFRQRWRSGIMAELAIFAVVFVVLLTILLSFDAFESFYAYSRDHENWELDEVVMALCSMGVTGFAFVARRWAVELKDKRKIQALSVELGEALEEAKKADKAKSAFLAGLSHELRTPLNAINGYAQLIECGIIGPIDARYAGYATNIRESGEHLLAMVDDILDVTRIVAGKLTLDLEMLDLRALSLACLKLLGPRAEKGKIRLVSDVPEDLPLVAADGKRLKQILINLVGNAVKFSPPEATVTLQARLEGDNTVIKVIDEGVGMASEDIELALQPFNQIENSLARSHEGVGLGLSIVKSLVGLHGGSLLLASAVGKGTTATVVLPRHGDCGPAVETAEASRVMPNG
ncbi:HAMP domain-containing sensor histidine kinase [Pelagibius sp. CAU 1746]|uniref:sensor histidine kinase n=1 Tax=Pelagibius sp. CAU 1746 TaxID=3140370 RepID=UPI00325B9B21